MMILKYQRGMSLVELLIAMFIISTVLLLLIQSFSQNLGFSNSVLYSNTAQSLAQEMAEWMYSERDRISWDEFCGDELPISMEQGDATMVYHRKVICSDPLKDFIIEVSWEYQGQPFTEVLKLELER